MKQYQRIVGKINYGLFLATIILLPFPQVFLRYACVIWFAAWLLEGRWCQKKNMRPERVVIPFALFALWYALEAISGLWAEDMSQVTWALERHMAIPMMLPIALWGVNDRYDFRQIRRLLVYACVGAAGVYAFTMYWVCNHSMVDVPSISQEPQALTLKYFSDGISVLKHRLFLCSVETLGIIAACYRKRELLERYGKVTGWGILCTEIAIMLALILATGSRASIFTMAALTGVAMIDHTPKRYKIVTITGALALCVLMSICVVRFHPRMKTFNWEQFKLEQVDDSRDPRFNIWSLALQNTEDYRLKGLGAGQSTGYLIEKYKENGFNYYAQKRFATHNQYLQAWMEIGTPGLILFLLAWISILLCSSGPARRTGTYLLTVYGLNMLTDNMFGRYDGIALWCFWMIIILLQQRHQQQNADAATGHQTDK